MKIAIALAACFLATSALAQDIRVIDGDTFEMDGEVIRLWGIDAPELDQLCAREGSAATVEVQAGQLAAVALASGIGRVTRCETLDTDRFGRTIARCYWGNGEDLGGQMVRFGWAMDWPEYSNGAYADEQSIAQQEELGIWVSGCIPPWEWRARNG